jgi:hypothetical protein
MSSIFNISCQAPAKPQPCEVVVSGVVVEDCFVPSRDRDETTRQMYGNVGLKTPRGTGTSGHLTKNQSHLSESKQAKHRENIQAGSITKLANARVDPAIGKHQQQRAKEVAIMLYRDELEVHGGFNEEEIAEKVEEYRKSLPETLRRSWQKNGVSDKEHPKKRGKTQVALKPSQEYHDGREKSQRRGFEFK